MLISVTCTKFWHALRRVAMPFHPFSKFNFNVALLSTSLKGISAAHESISLQTSCVLVTGFFYTSLHVRLCSAAAISCSFPGHPFKLRFCSFPGHPFKTWVLKIWKKSQETHSSFTNTSSNKIQQGATSKPNRQFCPIPGGCHCSEH